VAVEENFRDAETLRAYVKNLSIWQLILDCRNVGVGSAICVRIRAGHKSQAVLRGVSPVLFIKEDF